MKRTEEIFAENLRERRRTLGLTQRALAERLGYSEKTVSKWESGGVIAPSVVLPELAKALLTDIDSLLYSAGEPHYYLGIDGGGTKTEFLLLSASGETVSHAMLGASNPVDLGLQAALEVLAGGINAVCGEIPRDQISAFAGIAGGTTSDYRKRIHAFLNQYRFAACENGNDAQNAIAATLRNGNGTVVILGTGIVAFSQINGALIRRGGFGYLLEEGGSGYAIGRDVLRAALLDEEGSGEATALTALVLERLSSKSVLEKLSTFYESGKRGIASFAPLAYQAYRAGDCVAREILQKNMVAAAGLIRNAPRTGPGRQRVFLTGGQMKEAAILMPMLKDLLGGDYELTVSEKKPVYGAVMLAGYQEEPDA